MSVERDLQEDVVVLVPGFFGFRKIGRFSYFGEDIAFVLEKQGALKLGKPVSVRAMTTVPTGHLQSRVRHLAEQLSQLLSAGAKRFYLVGHSTGGVDANLLMTVGQAGNIDWPDRLALVQASVKAVFTISAPHYGTALLDSPAGRFVAHPTQAPFGIGSLAYALSALPGIALRDIDVAVQALDPRALQLPDLLRFIRSMKRHHELLDELAPHYMEAIRAAAKPINSTPTYCFVSGTDGQEGENASDPFYLRMNKLCRTVTSPHADVLATAAKIRAAPETDWIGNIDRTRFKADALTNDGIVNTARQLLPDATLAGIILGDHGDVIGAYDRADQSAKRESTGLFHSGAGFGDGELYELYSRIAALL